MREVKNRKLQNRERERQKKHRARLITTVFIAVAAMVIAAVVWVVWDTQSRSWILRFEGQRIHTNDLRAFIGDGSPEAKEAGMDILLEYLTLLHRAEQHGLGLNDEEREMWEWMVGSEFGEVPYLSLSRLTDFVTASPGQFGIVWERLMDWYIHESLVFIDEERFAAELAEQIEENYLHYLNTDVNFIFIEELEDAEAARVLLLTGERTFEEIVREYDPWFDEEEGVNVLPLRDFPWDMMTPEQTEMILALQVGDISELIAWGDDEFASHLILYVVEREEVDLGEIERDLRNFQIFNERNRMMTDLVAQWVRNVSYTRNERAFNLA
jgi:hypothetical protein